MTRLPGPASSSPSAQRCSTPLLLLVLLIASGPLQVSSQPEASDEFDGDNGQTAADLDMLRTLLDNLGEHQLEALEPQLRRLYNGHLLNSRMTRRGGYDPEVNRMARVIKKSSHRPGMHYEDNIKATKKGDLDNLVARIIKRGDMDNLVARIIKRGGGDMDNLVARIIKRPSKRSAGWHALKRNNYLRLGFNPEGQDEGGEFGFRRR